MSRAYTKKFFYDITRIKELHGGENEGTRGKR